jgi:hypothetical protein
MAWYGVRGRCWMERRGNAYGMHTIVLFESGIVAEGAVAAGEPRVGGLHCKLFALVRCGGCGLRCNEAWRFEVRIKAWHWDADWFDWLRIPIVMLDLIASVDSTSVRLEGPRYLPNDLLSLRCVILFSEGSFAVLDI